MDSTELVAVRPHAERPGAGRLEPFGAVAVAEADDAETGAEALLGMGPGSP